MGLKCGFWPIALDWNLSARGLGSFHDVLGSVLLLLYGVSSSSFLWASMGVRLWAAMDSSPAFDIVGFSFVRRPPGLCLEWLSVRFVPGFMARFAVWHWGQQFCAF